MSQVNKVEDVIADDVTAVVSIIDNLSPSEYGISTSKAIDFTKAFMSKLGEFPTLQLEYENILAMDDKEKAGVMARELRLKLVKVRTGSDAVHKEEKASYKNVGKFLDRIKSRIHDVIEPMEKELYEVENFKANEAASEEAKLEAERNEELSKYTDVKIPNLGKMIPVVWESMLNAYKMAFEAEQKAKESKPKFIDEALHIERKITLNELKNFLSIEFCNEDLDLSSISMADFYAEVTKASAKRFTRQQEEHGSQLIQTQRVDVLSKMGLLFNPEKSSYSTIDGEVNFPKSNLTASDAEWRFALESVTEQLENKSKKSHSAPTMVQEVVENKQFHNPDKQNNKSYQVGTKNRQELFIGWVNDFFVPEILDKENVIDPVAVEIIQKFSGFKKWACNLVKEKIPA